MGQAIWLWPGVWMTCIKSTVKTYHRKFRGGCGLGTLPGDQYSGGGGIADEKHGHVGVAFIQLHEDTPENRSRAEKYSQEHLAKFQVPKYFIYMTSADWPRTSTGKVQKFRLKEIAAARKSELDGRQKQQ